ncbi:hypothetical protein SGLAD_v1c07520 [Spiroplasma gladiatoris]|uniref:Uncharacterized protein n=1 Tax=Spiroplasma gladiatoris TaxID=2143 RepID=A0A4P7AIE5_9MOLU|nr:hypothetical protein [Spiroplasma gladiatoris]QBQ07951.1 hypothetical protein SGLAD_v1c07520 [Spiroplasma gladiatoris]
MYLNWKVYSDKSLILKNGKHNKHNEKIRTNLKDSKDKKITEINKKLKWLEMENEFLKKLNELIENSEKK